MTKQDVVDGITRIFAARDKKPLETTEKVWIDELKKWAIEKEVSQADIMRGIQEYIRSTDQFPVLGQLLERIKPLATLEIRMIDDVIAGRMKYESLPAEVRKALKTIGGYGDYKTGNSYERNQWLKKYKDTRDQDERGYQPIHTSHQVEAPETEKPLTGKAAEDRIALLKAMLDQKKETAAETADRIAP